MKCKINDININYEVFGRGKPVLIIHGFSVDHRLMTGCLEPVFEQKENYKRIYVDMPGMGKSESADWINCADDLLETLLKFIDIIIPSDNFLLIGESYGGYMARGILQKMPNRVNGLNLICPVIFGDQEKRELPQHEVFIKEEEFLSTLDKESARSFDSMAVIQTEEMYNRYDKEIMTGVKLADQIFLKKIQENGYFFSYNIDKLEKKFDKPSLFLFGKQDSVVGYKDSFKIIDNYTRVTLSIIDKAGHNLQIEQKELFDSLTLEWLKRVENIKEF